METPLGITFSTNEKIVSQCDDLILGSTNEILVIQFNQEKLEQPLSVGSTSPLCVHKHMKVFIAKASLANFWKCASGEA